MSGSPSIRQLPTGLDQLRLEAVYAGAQAAALFDCLTRAGRLVSWWPQTAETDPRLGGRYRLAWPALGQTLFGEYTQFEPGRNLAFTWNWEHAPELSQRVVSVQLAPLGEGTQLTLAHGPYRADARDQDDRQSHLDGWRYFLARLAQCAESGS